MYDIDNVFFKILQKEIPSNIIFEDDVCVAFPDISPRSRVHIIVITKKKYQNFEEFMAGEPAANVQKFFKNIAEIAKQAGIDKTGYRLVTNQGPDARQEVQHFHVHIMGGNQLER